MTTDTRHVQRTYDPNRLLDALKELLKLESDLALAQLLEIPPPVISQIRHRGYPMAPSILIRMHEVSSLSIGEMREIIGDRRKRVRTSYDMSYANTSVDERNISTAQLNGAPYLIYFSVVLMLALIIWFSRH